MPGAARYISWKPGCALSGPRQPAPSPGQCPLASVQLGRDSAEMNCFEANLRVSAKGQDAGREKSIAKHKGAFLRKCSWKNILSSEEMPA